MHFLKRAVQTLHPVTVWKTNEFSVIQCSLNHHCFSSSGYYSLHPEIMLPSKFEQLELLLKYIYFCCHTFIFHKDFILKTLLNFFSNKIFHQFINCNTAHLQSSEAYWIYVLKVTSYPDSVIVLLLFLELT